MLTVQSYETHAPNRLSELLFFNDTATTEIYTLSLHDALPILCLADRPPPDEVGAVDGDDRVYPAAHVPLVVETRAGRSEEHTSELQSQSNLVCRLLLEKKKETDTHHRSHITTAQPMIHASMHT